MQLTIAKKNQPIINYDQLVIYDHHIIGIF